MKKIAIVTDSNSGISAEDAKKYEIHVLPMIFYVDGQECREGISLTENEFFEALNRGAQVSTSQPSTAEMIELWEELLESYDQVLHIPMSKVLSGGYSTALAVSEEYGGRVQVVDGRRISLTQISMVRHARKLAEAGMEAEQIREKLEEESLDASIYLTVESLKYLKKGGRISGAEALAGDILNIKPIIQLKGGLLELNEKVRGRKKAKKAMEELLVEDWKYFSAKYPAEAVHIGIAHARAGQEALEWKEEMQKLFPGKEIEMSVLPLNICCHVGPGTIGAGVYVD